MIRQDQTTGLSFTEVTVSDGTLQVFSGFSREPGSATSLTSTNRRIAILNEFRRHRGGVSTVRTAALDASAVLGRKEKEPCKKQIQIKKRRSLRSKHFPRRTETPVVRIIPNSHMLGIGTEFQDHYGG